MRRMERLRNLIRTLQAGREVVLVVRPAPMPSAAERAAEAAARRQDAVGDPAAADAAQVVAERQHGAQEPA